MRKLMWFTIGFAIAVALGSYMFVLQWYLLAAGACAVLLCVFLVSMLWCPSLRLPAMVLFGCIVGFCYQACYDGLYVSVARSADEMQLSTTVYATDYSYDTDYGCAVDGRVEISGRWYAVKVYLPADTTLEPGEWVNGKFTFRATLPDCSRDSRYYAGSGVFLLAYPAGELVVGTPKAMPAYALPAFLRCYILDMVDYLFPEDTQAFAKALLLGDTDSLSYELNTALKLSGIRHVVAVSGLHVSILFSLIYMITGRRRWLNALIGLPLLLLFAAIAGFSASITRACIMHALIVIALLFDREYDPATALAFAVLVILGTNPRSFTDVGFQLSVGCMVGILLFSTPIRDWIMDKKRMGRFKGRLARFFGSVASGISISIGANIVTTSLSAMYFGVVSLIGMLTNLLCLWVISVIFYGIILSCIVALIHAPLGCAIAGLVSLPIRFVMITAKGMADFPFAAVYTQSVYILCWLVLCYVLLAVYLLFKKKHPVVLASCATMGLCLALFTSWVEPLLDECRVTVLDVGQGQCILLQSEGRNFLVDCGGTDDENAADTAAALLLSQGVSKLDGLILTHYDRDHAAGAAYLLTRVEADCLYLPNCADADGTAQALYNTGIGYVMVEEDVQITFSNVMLTLIPSESNLTGNESGMCILFQTENCDILITGDRDTKGEQELLSHMQLPDLELLIVGHHGSKYSTSIELLEATTPEYAVISVGENHYGHPTQEVLDRLREYGCIVYRTDQNGTIVYRR